MIGVKLGRVTAVIAATAAACAAMAGLGAGVASAAGTITVCAAGPPTCDASNIQSAISAAANGDTIQVGAGVYTQTIDVNKSVTIEGDGTGNTIIDADPATLSDYPFTPLEGTTNEAIVLADAPNVTIEDLTVDGLDQGNSVGAQFDGIAEHNDNLTVSDVHVIGMSDSPPNGAQTGDGIYAVNDGSTPRGVTVTNSRIYDFQKNGIAVDGNSDVTVDIVGNTVVADGPAGIGSNGIEVYDLWWEGTPPPGPTGTITGNDVTGAVCTEGGGVCGPDLLGDGPVDDDISGEAAGVLLGNVSDLTVSGNSVGDSDIGVWATTASGSATTISGNTLADNLYADVLSGTGTTTISGNTIGSGPDSAANLAGVLVANYSGDASAADASITANTISGTDVGVEVAQGRTPGAPTPSAIIANNAISGNTQGIENTTTAAVDAADNWFGCNGGPGATGCDTVTGSGASHVTSSPYLVLAVSALPSSIAPGATTTIVASIRQDSAGSSFPSGTFPSGVPVAFSTNAGALDGSETMVNGQAVTVLHGTPLGTATVTGAVDSQSANTSVTTANPSSTTSTAPSTASQTSATTTIAPFVAFLASGKLSLLAENPGSELAVTCVDGCSASVSGTIALSERRGKHKSVKKTLALATAQLTVAAGGSSVYSVSLTSSQRKTLKRATSATLTLNVSVTDDITTKTTTGSKSFSLTRN